MRPRYVAFATLLRIATATIILLVATGTAYGQSNWIGAFRSSRRQDLMDDTEKRYIYTSALVAGQPLGSVSISWHCRDNESAFSVVMLNNPMIGNSKGQVLVRMRFDTAPASSGDYWMLGQSGTSVRMPKENVRQFTTLALKAVRLALQISDPYDGETLTNAFSLDGLANSLPIVWPCKP